MNFNKKTVIFVSSVAVLTIVVMMIFSPRKVEKKEQETTVPNNNVEYSEEAEATPIVYTVCLEEGRVILYQVENEEKIPIEMVEIDANYYPDEDIKELIRGIDAYTLEEGFKILENFAN